MSALSPTAYKYAPTAGVPELSICSSRKGEVRVPGQAADPHAEDLWCNNGITRLCKPITLQTSNCGIGTFLYSVVHRFTLSHITNVIG